jgi:hypothetical protein
MDLFPKLLEWLLIPNKCLMMPCKVQIIVLILTPFCFSLSLATNLNEQPSSSSVKNSPNFAKEKGDKIHLSGAGSGVGAGAGASAGVAASVEAYAGAGACVGAVATASAPKSDELRPRMEEEDFSEVRGHANPDVPRRIHLAVAGIDL